MYGALPEWRELSQKVDRISMQIDSADRGMQIAACPLKVSPQSVARLDHSNGILFRTTVQFGEWDL